MRRIVMLFLLLPLFAIAQQQLEVIELRHRTAEQLIPVLQPLVEPGGSISGMYSQLIVRASAQNRQQIRQALTALDRPSRTLMIRVAQNRDEITSGSGAQAYGRIESGNLRIVQPPQPMPGGGRVEIRSGESVIGGQVGESRSSGSMRSGQSVRVSEGGRAYINVGQSLPLPLRQVVRGPGGVIVTDSVVYRDVGQGFYAEPRLSGDRVTLEISPQYDTPGNQGVGSVNTQRLSTTVSGRLGEWIELGGVNQQSSNQSSANFSSGSRQVSDQRSVWLLVEEVP